ncbi:MAG: RagB/SusD family nutrient uptake outer membrane protein [Bacteroidales bacterium]|nr:RagB/SusD family nutrient uptake outer membrane protein [Bacteroidales bacterium]
MKKYIYISAISLCLCAVSCGYLDEEPYHYLTEEAALITEANYLKPSNMAYSFIPDGYNCVGNAFLDCATDDAMATASGSNVHKLARGNVSADSPILNPWANCYRGIHQALFAQYGLTTYKPFLAGKTEAAVEELLERYYNEMNALQALYGFILLQHYGGFPIIDEYMGLDDEEALEGKTRDTFADCVEHIVALCDSAANHLPVKLANSEVGRMTQGAALAIKAKTLVYAASPLYNQEGNTNPLIGYTAATVPSDYPEVTDRWKRAAAACAAVINLKGTGYALVAANNSAAFNTAIFNANGNCAEWIVMKTAAKNNSMENRHYPPSLSKNNGGGTVPTQDLVNAFTKSDGSDISVMTDGTATVYTGRDRRFDAFIAYEGCKTFASQIYTHIGDGATKDALNATTDHSTTTGYYLAKHLSPKINFTAASPGTYFHIWPIIRFSDIYLLYAEAMVNGYGDFNVDPEGYGLTALGAIQAIRKRAGYNASTDKFYNGITSAEDFMNKVVKRERRVELCFEGQRYFDLRRWLDAEEVLNKPVHGVEITKTGSNLAYKYFEADNRRTFTSNMYFSPIPKSVLKLNKAIQQNPGY